MSKYYLRRTARAILTVWVVASLTFGLIRLLPGGPIDMLRQQLFNAGYDSAQIDAYIAQYTNVNPKQPIWRDYIDYMAGLMQGDLGRSYYYDEPVADILANAIPWTVFVVVSTVILAFGFGIVMGAVMAYKEGSWFDNVGAGISIVSVSTPFYITGVLLVFSLGYQLELFPPMNKIGGDIENTMSLEFVLSALHHAALPIISFTFGQLGVQALAMRGNSIQVLGEDYVKVARLRGLPDRRIATRYVARNAILPMYTGLMLSIGFLLGGTVILERVFNYRAMGYYMWEGLTNRDSSLMMGTFLVITVSLVIGIYIADLTYGLIDPRVARGESNEAY